MQKASLKLQPAFNILLGLGVPSLHIGAWQNQTTKRLYILANIWVCFIHTIFWIFRTKLDLGIVVNAMQWMLPNGVREAVGFPNRLLLCIRPQGGLKTKAGKWQAAALYPEQCLGAHYNLLVKPYPQHLHVWPCHGKHNVRFDFSVCTRGERTQRCA